MLLLIIIYIISIVLIGLSIYLRYWRGRRKFQRRNVAGLEEFKSYGDALKKRYLENLVQFIYIFFTIVGILLLLMAIFGAKDIMRINIF